jgi:protein-S-isoprenylcysteine O-methyltransferase Ste14
MRMAEEASAKTPWEFQLRTFVIAIAFGLGFFLGYPIQSALTSDLDPTFVLLGRPFGDVGIDAAAWVAAAIAVLGYFIRLWASSYHSPGVVMSRSVVTDTFFAAGPYRYVRNPLYLGNVFLALSIGSLGPPVATALVFAFNLLFVYRLIFIEERFLRSTIGEAYERYCKAVPRLWPRLTPADLPEDDRKPNLLYGMLTELFMLGFAAAMVYFAIVVPHGGGRHIGTAFWSIAGFAIILQIVLAPSARRADADRS